MLLNPGHGIRGRRQAAARRRALHAWPARQHFRARPARQRGFRTWRARRPFAGGLLTALAGLAILWAPLAPLTVVMVQGLAGFASLVIAALLIGMGSLSWFQPQLCPLLGVVAVVLALASLLTSNLGGFGVGAVLGLLGGSLIFAWTPAPRQRPGGQSGANGRGPGLVASAALLLVANPVMMPARAEACPESVSRAPATAPSGTPIAAGEPATLTADVVTMSTVAYRGVVEIPTADGPVSALRFEMESLALIGTALSAPGGPTLRNPNGAATLRGAVDLYVSRFAGLLFGGLPVVFSPSRPPPLVPPSAEFTGVRAQVVYLRADVVGLPSLRQTV